MRALILLTLLAVCLGVVLATGLDEALARMVVSLQRDFQNALGRSLRALRAGETAAVASFLGICFGYGFFHALGPGHGKAAIAAYGFASASAVRKMVGIAAVSSLGQACMAIALVYSGVWLWQGARDRVETLATRAEPLSMLAIAALGLLLAGRGVRRLRRPAPAAHQQTAGDHHRHSESCGCGHAHAPDFATASRVETWPEAAALILGISLRPCTGALLVLLLTWRLEIGLSGILGVCAMALGTFMITGLAALLTVALRKGITLSLPTFSGAARGATFLEIIAGSLLLVTGLTAAVRLF